MKTYVLIAILALSRLGSVGYSATTNDPTTALQKGLFEEEANHNLGEAIRLYQTVVSQFDKERKLAATALFRLGECYRKQGNTNQAVTQYQRVVSEFSDQTQLIEAARQNLAQLGGSTSGSALSVSARDKQRQLYEEEIKILETKLAADQKRRESGIASQEDIWATQRELLKLKRQLAALEGGMPLALAAKQGDVDVADNETRARGPEPAAPTNTEAEEVRRIKAMIKDSPDLINAPDQSGNRSTPLIKAAMSGQLVVCRFLIEAKADLENKDASGCTALYWAASQGSKGIVELLLASKAQPNNPNAAGKTPLHAAAEKGFRAVVEVLLAKGATVNATDNAKATPLHYSVANGFRSLAELLLEKGADPNVNASRIMDFRGTPLHITATRGDLPMTDLLLNHKADPELTNVEGLTPLHAAARGDHVQVAAALLKHGAKVDTRNSNEENRGWTALHFAVVSGGRETAELLLNNGADPNATIETGFGVNLYGQLQIPGQKPPPATGYTPLMIAAAKCTSGIISLLLSAKADPNIKADAGDTALINTITLCSNPERAKIVALLLDHGASPEMTDRYNRSALLLAAGKDPQALTMLLKHGANPNARDNENQTALHYLAFALEGRGPYQDMLNMARELIDAGTDVNAQAKDGRTPLKVVTDLLARSSGSTADEPRKQFAEILRKAGAVEDLPRLDRIEIARASSNYSVPLLWRGTNDYNRFSIFELIAVAYDLCAAPPTQPAGNSSENRRPVRLGVAASSPPMAIPGPIRLAPQGLAFPDFSRVVIHRATPDGKSRMDVRLHLADAFNSGSCSSDQMLNWGDVIEIPESDHPINANWQGLAENTRALLTQCLSRTVEVRVKGQSTNMVLIPAPPPAALRDFSLLSVLNASGLLRASSDLSRVKVTRHDRATSQSYELQLDCSPTGRGYDLWLRQGDRVEVPERP